MTAARERRSLLHSPFRHHEGLQPGFVHLDVRSNFSLKDGAFFPEELAVRAAELGMPAVALTDRDGLYGGARFVEQCAEAGVKPILGATLTLATQSSIVVLAEDAMGYANLCRLITDAHMTGERGDPSLVPTQVLAHAEGLICLLGPRSTFGALAAKGLHDAARDANVLLTVTAQTQWVRWQATVNLLELASLDGMQDAFDAHADELRRAPIGPMLRSYFLLFLGEGLERFGRYEAAEQALTEAIDYSTANQIFAVSFKAEEAVAAVRARSARTAAPSPSFDHVPQEILSAAYAISELRKAAISHA